MKAITVLPALHRQSDDIKVVIQFADVIGPE